MSDLNLLLQNVIQHPDDDTARLVYADCLEEQQDPISIKRAEFIRVGVELGKWEHVVLSPDDAHALATSHDYTQYASMSPHVMEDIMTTSPNREWGLPAKICGIRITVDFDSPTSGLRSVADFRDRSNHPTVRNLRGKHWDLIRYNHVTYAGGAISLYRIGTPLSETFTIERGMVSEVRCRSEDFIQYALHAIWPQTGDEQCPTDAQPIQKVTLTTPCTTTPIIHTREDQRIRCVRIRGNVSILGKVYAQEHNISQQTLFTYRGGDRARLMEDYQDQIRQSLSPAVLLPKRFPGIRFVFPGDTTEYYQELKTKPVPTTV